VLFRFSSGLAFSRLGTGDGPAATNVIEQCKWNPRNGMIYLNVPEVNGDGNDDVPGHTVIIDPRKWRSG
jgi:hypothetical protein